MSYELVFVTVGGGEIRLPLTKDLRDKVFEQLRATDWSTKTFYCNGTIINLAQVISVSKADRG